MNILLINNHTQHLEALNEALSAHNVEIQSYEPGITFNDAGKDLVILSGGGGEGLEIYDKVARGKLWYEDQMNYVLTSKKPILGICMGFEVICSAYGALVPKMPKLIQGFMELEVTNKGKEVLGNTSLRQYEAHQWYVPSVSEKYFDVLAESPTGVEVIRHKWRPILATQFHPEVTGGTLIFKHLFKALKTAPS